jgi:hypothetical protein
VSPIEIMAKAMWENQPAEDEDGEDTWENVPDFVKMAFIEQARAALLALAKVKPLPAAVWFAGQGQPSVGAAFRDMLLVIAGQRP